MKTVSTVIASEERTWQSLEQIASACGLAMTMDRSAALGIGAASFFVFHKKDTAESPTPTLLGVGETPK